jgi:hypothetical protein
VWKDKDGNIHTDHRVVSVFRRKIPVGTSVKENKVDAKIEIKGKVKTFKNALIV